MLFQGFLVLDHAVQGTIEPILFCHPLVGVQQCRHGCLRKPFFVNGELAARRNESVDHEQFTTFSEATPPACSPSARPQNSPSSSSSHNLHPTQHAPNCRGLAPPGWRAAPRLHPRAPPRPSFSVPVGKEPHPVTPSVFFDHFDCALPALKLRGVQFPKCSTRRCKTRLRPTRRLSQSE